MNAQIAIDTNGLAQEITQSLFGMLKPLLTQKAGDDAIFSVGELAKYLKVSDSWVYAHKYELPHIKIAGNLRFKKKDIDRVIDQLMFKNGSKGRPQPKLGSDPTRTNCFLD